MGTKFKRTLAVMLSIIFILTGCGGGDGNDQAGSGDGGVEKIIIGGLAPLTGNVAIYGVTASNGAKLAFKEINENGGILGKEVEFLLEDEKGDPTEAVNAYTKLLDEDIVALLGDITSQPTEAVAESAKADNMPMLTPTGTQFNITEGRDNVFRVCYTDPFQGEILAKYAKEELGAGTAAIMKNTSSDYSDGVGKAFTESASDLGIDVVATESYGNDDIDFRAQLTKIAELNPDVLVIPDYYQTISLIAPQAREVGITGTFLGPDGWDGVTKNVDESSYDVIEGAVFTNHYSIDDEDEKIQNFLSNYKEEYGEDASAFAALAYDGAYMLKEAIEKAGSTDSDAIIKALKEIEFDGITGLLTFDENNNPIKTVSMIKIVDGEYKLDRVMDLKE